MTEDQLERLLRRLSVLQRQPATLSQYATPGPFTDVTVSNSGQTKVLNPDKFRWGVLLSAGAGGTISVGFGQPNVNLTTGLIIPTAQPPVIITYNDIGAAILSTMWAVGSVINLHLFIQTIQVGISLDRDVGGWVR